jgi:hypothetical protein
MVSDKLIKAQENIVDNLLLLTIEDKSESTKQLLKFHRNLLSTMIKRKYEEEEMDEECK